MFALLPVSLLTGNLRAVAASSSTASDPAYTILGNVTYQITVTLDIANADPLNPLNVSVYAPRIKNWSADVPAGTPSIQASTLENATPYGCDIAIFNQNDSYDNRIDYYSKLLARNFGTTVAAHTFELSTNYTTTINQLQWNNLGTHTMDEYDTNSAFYKLYTEDQPTFITVSDPAIQAKAKEIAGADTDPAKKALDIYNWVKNNLQYVLQPQISSSDTGEKGASWALTNLEGDCSEFSDLTVAMLRAQGVPARKITGIALTDANGRPFSSYQKGATWDYIQSTAVGNGNFTGHAWVEYYVPGAGWVSLDPTWGNAGQDYYNKMDYLHLGTCRGEYFGSEVQPPISPEIGEFPALPMVEFQYTGTLDYTYSLDVQVAVLESHISADTSSLSFIVIVIVLICVIALACWLTISIRRGKQKKRAAQQDRANFPEWK
ncbi:MAG TPA: transglutaminase-like domain-containing protein [Candidatus Lokiarchaeia archaeon]|nr:transglutaminase-like domain-containing protein [Candidatus Lokiarchaeia archaeon]